MDYLLVLINDLFRSRFRHGGGRPGGKPVSSLLAQYLQVWSKAPHALEFKGVP